MNTFSGNSPSAASAKLRECAKKTANDVGLVLEVSHDQSAPGLLVDWTAATRNTKGSFYLQITFDEDGSVPFTLRANPHTDEFGTGRLTTIDAAFDLELKHKGGAFEWWTEVYSDGKDKFIAPFALTTSFIEESLRKIV